MDRLAHHFVTMACNNAWANHRLLAACALLPPSDFAAVRVSFFPSIRATLNHNLTVDWYYVDAMERSCRGSPPNADAQRYFDPREPFAEVAPLASAQREVDRRLIALCRSLDAPALAREVTLPRRARQQVEGLGRVLAHLFQHQIHHRGQAHAMLAGTAVPPPQLDEFFLADEAPLRAAELAALGLTEEAIWGGAD